MFTILVREMKELFNKEKLILTAAVGAGKKTIDKGYEIAEVAEYFDFVNIMAYVSIGCCFTKNL